MTFEEQLELLTNACVDLHTLPELREKLELGRPLRVKYGADPSAPDLHLGHSVPLRKLRQFQELGHQVVFIIGDFTGRIGDPSGRSKTRPMLTEEEIAANAQTYAEQVGRILDLSKCEIRYNSEWFGSMSASQMLEIATHYTVARMLERDDFALRLRDGVPITLIEMLYPLVQAYDSVAVEADIEIGGSDQLFNLLVGRDIMRAYGMTPQVVMTWPLLLGTDGKEKMSKSLGNYIGITEPPEEMYGKLMSIPDELMAQYYHLLLDMPRSQVEAMQRDLESGKLHPREAKANLARRIVSLYHGQDAAQRAAAEFDRVFAQRQKPTDMQPILLCADDINDGTIGIIELVVRAGFAKSNSEARRLIRQGAVRVQDRVIEDEMANIEVEEGAVLQVGKRRFGRITITRGDNEHGRTE